MEIKKIIFFILIIFTFAACNQNEIYFQYKKVSEKGWSKDSLLRYNVDVQDTLQKYDIFIHIRHNGSYPYQNFWIFMNEIMPDSVIKNDTLEYFLADEYGKWLGTGAGALKEMIVLYKKQIQFPEKGKYQFEITQGMRDSLLSGVHDVGLRIEKTN